jgi:4-amino-4-deoxy-L-arabinose transferase-like glycosyltransferase
MSDSSPERQARGSSRSAWLLVPILALGLGLRAWNIDYGLPETEHPDEHTLVEPALRTADPELFTLDPHFYRYPALPIYTLAATYYVRGVLGGGSAARPALPTGPAALLHARWLTVGFALATLVAVYALGAAWRSRGTGLLAALFCAVTPLHVIHPHYANVDVPMVFWATLALVFALHHAQGGRRRDFLLTALALGLAAASKYTCLFMAPLLPMLAWLAARDDARPWRRIVALTAAGGVVCAATFLAAAPYTLIRFGDVWEALVAERAHVTGGHFGFDLNVDGVQYRPVVYQLLVGLPFVLGLPLYLSALAGGLTAWKRRDRTRLLVLAAGIGPIAVVVFLSRVVFPRYLLPLVPVAALGAALGATALWHSGRRHARALAALWVVLVVSYTGIFAGSLASQLSPQAPIQAAQWIRSHVPPGTELAVAVGPRMPGLLEPHFRQRRFQAQQADNASEWVVVCSWVSRAWERGHLVREPAHATFARLGSPGSDYERVASFTAEYMHESFYGLLDPYLRNQYGSPDVHVYRRRR